MRPVYSQPLNNIPTGSAKIGRVLYKKGRSCYNEGCYKGIFETRIVQGDCYNESSVIMKNVIVESDGAHAFSLNQLLFSMKKSDDDMKLN